MYRWKTNFSLGSKVNIGFHKYADEGPIMDV
jgi:hypothetical protein